MAVNGPIDEEKQKKLKALSDDLGLSHVFSEIDSLKDNNNFIRAKLEDFSPVIDYIKNAIATQQANTSQVTATPTGTAAPPMPFAGIDVEKVSVLSGLLDGLSKVVAAWKSGNATPQADSYFNDLSKQIVSNMLQAGVDGIMQNVYKNYNPVAPRPNWQMQRPTGAHEIS